MLWSPNIPSPEDFNDGIFVFPPKGDCEGDAVEVAGAGVRGVGGVVVDVVG